MKYSKVETLNHVISKDYPCCTKDYNQIILEEDNNLIVLPTIFTDVDVIDLDCVERIKARSERREQNSTMDSSFAISNKNKSEMILVEFRFNYKNLYNLNRNKLIDKVNGSIALLGNGLVINNNYIFIFQPNKVQEALNRISRMIPSLTNNYQVMDINSLIAAYF